MSVQRVRVVWSGTPTVGDGLSTFYFDGAIGTAAQQVAAVNLFLDSVSASYADNLAWSTQADVAVLNTATGALEGIIATTVQTGAGSLTDDQLSPATQGLLRLITSVVVGGRLLRGRLFLPGATEASNSAGGIPLQAYRDDYEAAAAVLIADANVQWSVWSRTHGALAPIGSANVWTKWAVLRSRRD